VPIEPRRDFRRQPSLGSFSTSRVTFSGETEPDWRGRREGQVLSDRAARHNMAVLALMALGSHCDVGRVKPSVMPEPPSECLCLESRRRQIGWDGVNSGM